jgi:hypothetical protein
MSRHCKLLVMVIHCSDGDGGMSSDVAEAGSQVQYWKPPVAIKYDAYASRVPPTGGTLMYDEAVRQTELLSDTPSLTTSTALHLDRGSTAGCGRPSHPDYFRAPVDSVDVVDFRMSSSPLSSTATGRQVSSRDVLTSFSTAHHVHCNEHVYEPTSHETMTFVQLPSVGGRTLNVCSGH